MTKFRQIFILLFLICSTLFAQTSKLIFNNNTDRKLQIFTIEYNKDSTKNIGSFQMVNGQNDKPSSFSSETNKIFDYLRMDIIAIDKSSNDTIYVKSFSIEQFKSQTLSVDINNDIEKLPPDLNPQPFLQIITDQYSRIYKVTDRIDIKLKNRNKIHGHIASFDKESITLKDLDGKIVIVKKKEILGLKKCGALYSVGVNFSILPYCRYSKLKSIKFRKVRQVLVEKKDKSTSLEWME
jgi:hypothetical protein